MKVVGQKVYESLIILKSISNELRNIEPALSYTWKKKSEEFYKIPRNEIDIFSAGTAMYAVLYFSILKYVSFLDEYKNIFLKSYGNLQEESAINNIKSLVAKKKYFESVEEIFPNIKNARNHILAHGYRMQKGKQKVALKSDYIEVLLRNITSHDSHATYSILISIPFRVIEEIEKEFGEIDRDVLSELIDFADS